jgi:hypothetical protein
MERESRALDFAERIVGRKLGGHGRVLLNETANLGTFALLESQSRGASPAKPETAGRAGRRQEH